LHNQRQNQNNERRGNEQKTAADNAGRSKSSKCNNRRSYGRWREFRPVCAVAVKTKKQLYGRKRP
jgi:hypothetical protein